MVSPPHWTVGRGYMCIDDIRILTAENLSVSLPAFELCGFLIARVHQLMKEMNPVRQQFFECQIWPNGDYKHRPSHLPPEDQQKG